MIVSSLYPRFRDMAIIWSVLSTVLFYATPVLYPIEKVPGDAARPAPAQPARAAARARAQVDRRPDAPGPAEAAGGWLRLLPAIAIFVAHRACWPSGCSSARRRGSPRSSDARGRARRGRRGRGRWCWPGSAVMERDVRLQARGAAALRSKGEPAVLARAGDGPAPREPPQPGDGAGPEPGARPPARAGATRRRWRCSRTCCGASPTTVMAWRVLALLSPDAAGRALAAQRRLDPVNARRR